MIPKMLHKFLWFNDIKKISPEKDKVRIIINVLDNGDQKVIKWLFKRYSTQDIKDAFLNHGVKGQLSKKSINYWKLILDIDSKDIIQSRF